MKFDVTNDELKNTGFVFQPLLRILKCKGAPIKGIFYLEIKDGYKVTRIDDPCCDMTTYIFEHKVLEE